MLDRLCHAALGQTRSARSVGKNEPHARIAFNDALDRAVGKPVAKAYVKVMPRFVRTGISNVFNNLNTLSTIVNDVLQGKMQQAGNDSARFLLNSTFGLGGLFDPASAAGLDNNDEDFGQTFGKWGMKSGPYLVLPFLGPSTTRDTFGKLVDQYTYPVTYLEDDSTRYIIRGVSLLDIRAGLLDLDAADRPQLRPLRLHPQCLAAAPRIPGHGRRHRGSVARPGRGHGAGRPSGAGRRCRATGRARPAEPAETPAPLKRADSHADPCRPRTPPRS